MLGCVQVLVEVGGVARYLVDLVVGVARYYHISLIRTHGLLVSAFRNT